MSLTIVIQYLFLAFSWRSYASRTEFAPSTRSVPCYCIGTFHTPEFMHSAPLKHRSLQPNSSKTPISTQFDKYRYKHIEFTSPLAWILLHKAPGGIEMTSFQGQTNAGIESDWRYTMIDEIRKRKKKQSNRESARRSRMRKQKELEDLTSEVGRLQIMNSRLVESINCKEQARIQIESMNNILRFETMELMHRLRALNSVLQVVHDSNALAVDVPTPLFEYEHWQLNLPMQPSAADPDLFLV